MTPWKQGKGPCSCGAVKDKVALTSRVNLYVTPHWEKSFTFPMRLSEVQGVSHQGLSVNSQSPGETQYYAH